MLFFSYLSNLMSLEKACTNWHVTEAYLPESLTKVLYGLYFSHKGCFSHVGVERQTNIHTYIHTHTFLENNFSKRQPLASYGRTPGLKSHLYSN